MSALKKVIKIRGKIESDYSAHSFGYEAERYMEQLRLAVEIAKLDALQEASDKHTVTFGQDRPRGFVDDKKEDKVETDWDAVKRDLREGWKKIQKTFDEKESK